MQNQKSIDDLEFQLHRLVPEHLHPEDRPERPEERENQQGLFRRPPFAFRGLSLVECECREGDEVEEDVYCEEDGDGIHYGLFLDSGGFMGFGFFALLFSSNALMSSVRLPFPVPDFGVFFFSCAVKIFISCRANRIIYITYLFSGL